MAHFAKKNNSSGVLVISPELYTQGETKYFRHLHGSSWHNTSDVVAIKTIHRYWSGITILFALLALLVVLFGRRIRYGAKGTKAYIKTV